LLKYTSEGDAFVEQPHPFLKETGPAVRRPAAVAVHEEL
jgi:hypothetical protein